MCTNVATATRLELESVPGIRLAGVILCCGVYGVRSLTPTSSTGKLFVDAAMWADSGARRYRDDEGDVTSISFVALPRVVRAAGDGETDLRRWFATTWTRSRRTSSPDRSSRNMYTVGGALSIIFHELVAHDRFINRELDHVRSDGGV